MRNFSFRAWDEKNKRMISEIGLFDLSDADEKLSIDELEECKIMQCTGKKDKNNKEIYEGDFLLHEVNGDGFVHLVRYDENRACFESVVSPLKWGETEVIGNIFETPLFRREL